MIVVTRIKIDKVYKAGDFPNLEFEYDLDSVRPAWIHIKDNKFNARFLSVSTDKDSGIIYKRFTGNFYYPVDLVIKKEEENKFYDKYAQFYDRNTARNNIPMAQQLIDKMIKYNIDKNANILDLGAGTGIFSELAIKNGFTNITLLDIYRSMLDVAKNKPLLENSNFIEGDVKKVLLINNYDVFVSVMMFDALDDEQLKVALDNIVPHLNMNGYIFLVEDKEREIYKNYFSILESGVFDISKIDKFQKFYLVAQKVN